MRRPASSKRALIRPVRFRRVASGLIIDNVRSIDMASTSYVGNRKYYQSKVKVHSPRQSEDRRFINISYKTGNYILNINPITSSLRIIVPMLIP